MSGELETDTERGEGVNMGLRDDIRALYGAYLKRDPLTPSPLNDWLNGYENELATDVGGIDHWEQKYNELRAAGYDHAASWAEVIEAFIRMAPIEAEKRAEYFEEIETEEEESAEEEGDAPGIPWYVWAGGAVAVAVAVFSGRKTR